MRFNEAEKKHATLTLQELDDMPSETVAYKAIGEFRNMFYIFGIRRSCIRHVFRLERKL